MTPGRFSTFCTSSREPSVELLSTTTISRSTPAICAAYTRSKVSANVRASLKTGMMMESLGLAGAASARACMARSPLGTSTRLPSASARCAARAMGTRSFPRRSSRTVASSERERMPHERGRKPAASVARVSGTAEKA